MRQLLQYIITTVIIAMFALLGINYFLSKNLSNQKEDVFGKLNTLFVSNEPYDIIFIGSSRIYHSVDPFLMDSITGTKCFNFGLDGNTIIEASMILNAYLENHPSPKIVVLNIDLFTLQTEKESTFRDFTVFLPYKSNSSVHSTLSEFLLYEKKLSFISFLTPAFYDDFKKFMAFKHVVNPAGNPDKILVRGCNFYDDTWEGNDLPVELEYTITTKGMDILKSFADVCKQNNIQLVLTYAPQTREYTVATKRFDTFLQTIDSLSRKNDALFFEYSCMDICDNRKFFKSHAHLNRAGAYAYTQKLAQAIVEHQK